MIFICTQSSILAPTMQCTFDEVIFNKNSGIFCDQWKSKQKYNVLAIGGDTKFTMLYVDFEIFGSRFANAIMEGGVRPPSFDVFLI